MVLNRSNARTGNLRMLCPNTGNILDSQSPLQKFLIAYTSLALRMARIDYRTLVEHVEDTKTSPDLVSDRYIHVLSNVMNGSFPFWRHLVDVSHYDIKITITAVMEKFVHPQEDGVALITLMTKEILDRSQDIHSLINKFFAPIFLVNRLMQQQHLLRRGLTEVDQELFHVLCEITSQAYKFFLITDERFQSFIDKSVSVLGIDICQGFVTQLSTLLRYCIASDDQLLQKVMSEKRLSLQGLTRDDGVFLAELAWKFETLRTCIIDGRMEIRVQGVETMQTELVNVYTKFINNSLLHKDHAIAQYLSDFMLANRLVEYLVGVESHPQLISRCGNIIGFLLVTNRYTEAESDIIWRTVTNSQDSRFVEAVLGMLPSIFNIASYPILLYLTSKLNELPIHAFDVSVITYAQHLLDNLQQKIRYDLSDSKMDMPPFDLCIRLIRQAAAEPSIEASKKRQIHRFATAQVGNLLQLGPSDTDRRAMYEECIRDITERNEFATGSISAINALISPNIERELASLTEEWDLARLVIEEFAHKIQSERSTEKSPMLRHEQLEYRMNLIQNIILFIPDTITAGVGTMLWDFGVGSKALNHNTRENAWMAFLQVIRRITTRNSFIDQCVREHLPRLQPCFYNEGCLYFAQDVSHYHFRTAVSRPQDDVKQETTAEDLLWHISLTATPGTIERKAIEGLVALYLDSPENTRRTRSAIETMHIGVVERCVRQLSSAASKLKSFSDGTSSGEDEPMIVVASEDETQKQRLSFSRALAILKVFLGGVRARPKYSPQLQTQPQLPYDALEMKGERILVRYQPFGVGTTGEMRTVDVGNLETMQEFTRRLKFLTGFSKLTLISGGQKLDLAKVSTMTLQELRLDSKGLLLVKKDPEVDATSEPAPAPGLRPIEAEILSHFLELYPLLGMEEKLGKEVSLADRTRSTADRQT